MLGASRWRVRRVAETGSTNADLIASARAGEPAGAVLVTDHQVAGRGRLGRTWTAPPGVSLLVSVLLRPTLPARRLHRVTQAVAVAARRACEEVAGVTAEIKWPNDLLVGSRKLAGILAESVLTTDGDVEAVVVGMGLNVNWPPLEELPADLAERVAALNHLAGHAVDRDRLLDAYLAHLLTLDDEEAVAAAYRDALGTLGRAVRVERPGGVLEGTAVALDADGALVVRTSLGDESVSAGDVIHLR